MPSISWYISLPSSAKQQREILGLWLFLIYPSAYLLLTEFEGRTVSYVPSFSPSIDGSRAKRAGHISKGKLRGSVTYCTDQENEVSKIFIISLPCV